jgi:putative transposase
MLGRGQRPLAPILRGSEGGAHWMNMPRRPRVVIPGFAHHVTQRGNYKQKVFYREQDRKLYLEMLKEYSRHYGVAVQAYCLMDNHVHLILTPHDATGMSRLLQRLHSEYARALHVRLRRVGHLWQARYGSTVMDEKHLWAAMVYVEQNRLRAGLVSTAGDWRWCSAQAHLTGNDQGWMDFVDWASGSTVVRGNAAWTWV